jgi:Fe-S cluster assembly protein SufD
MTGTPGPKQTYLAAFETFEAATPPGTPAWLRERRRAAIARFAEIGFPSPREEDWRYTNLSPIVTTPFRPAVDAAADALGPGAIEPFRLGPAAWPRLVFVNGRYAPALSAPGPLPAGVRAGSLAAALAGDADGLAPHLARSARDADGFIALNTAFLQDGAFLSLPPGVVVETPIQLLFVTLSAGPGAAPLAQPRNLVLAGPGSQATLVERYVSLAPDAYLTNAVTEVVAAPGAVLDHVKLQEESENAFHVGTLHVQLERDAGFTSCSVTMGARLARNTLHMTLAAEGATCTLDGLYVVGGRQHVDNHITVDHTRPHGTSRQLYKGILDGKSKAVFNGRIVVRPGAQKTDAYQTNKNLLLSDGPEVASKPWLEIFADDVKCTHGAADGQLSEEAIFYLRSRGLSEAAARSLLTYGFANEVIGRIRIEPVRTHVDTLLRDRLQKGLATKETS